MPLCDSGDAGVFPAGVELWTAEAGEPGVSAFEGVLIDPAGLSKPWEARLEPDDPELPELDGTFPPCAPLSTSCDGELDPAGTEPAGEELPGDDLLGEELPGEELPGEELPGEELPGEELPGEELPGDELLGKEPPGEEFPDLELPGKELPGDELLGEELPGEEFSGEGPAGMGRGGPWCPDPGIPAIAVLEGPYAPEPGTGTPVGGATHLVQIVEIVVLVMVDTD